MRIANDAMMVMALCVMATAPPQGVIMKKQKRLCTVCNKRPSGYYITWTNHRGDFRKQWKSDKNPQLCLKCWKAECDRNRSKV